MPRTVRLACTSSDGIRIRRQMTSFATVGATDRQLAAFIRNSMGAIMAFALDPRRRTPRPGATRGTPTSNTSSRLAQRSRGSPPDENDQVMTLARRANSQAHRREPSPGVDAAPKRFSRRAK